MILIDTDVIVDIRRGHPPAVAWFSQQPKLPGIPGYVALELNSGCEDLRAARSLDRFLAPFEVVWPTTEELESVLRQFAVWKLAHGLGLTDALIAATAVGAGATLLTFNERHFRSVPGIVTERPYIR